MLLWLHTRRIPKLCSFWICFCFDCICAECFFKMIFFFMQCASAPIAYKQNVLLKLYFAYGTLSEVVFLCSMFLSLSSTFSLILFFSFFFSYFSDGNWSYSKILKTRYRDWRVKNRRNHKKIKSFYQKWLRRRTTDVSTNIEKTFLKW